MYIPEGFGTVFPYIVVDQPMALIDFLVSVFGANIDGKTQMPDGRLANVRVGIGSSKFMVGQAVGDGFKAAPAAYYIYVEDVDRTYASAIQKGAVSIFEPDDMPYGDRQAGVIDPTGNSWWISRRLIEAPYDT